MVSDKCDCTTSFEMPIAVKEDVIQAWNNRPIEDSLRQEVERLRALTEWQTFNDDTDWFGGDDVLLRIIYKGFYIYKVINHVTSEFGDWWEDRQGHLVNCDGEILPLPSAPQIEGK